MASHTINHDVSFVVSEEKQYILNVVIGNGQVGSTTFKNIDGKLFTPDIVNSLIGQGAKLVGRSLNIVSVVIEVNPDDDDMVVSYWISDSDIDVKKVDPTDQLPFAALKNETITFVTKVNFIK